MTLTLEDAGGKVTMTTRLLFPLVDISLEGVQAGQTVRVEDESSLAVTGRPPLDAFEIDRIVFPDSVTTRQQERPLLSVFWVPDQPIAGSASTFLSPHGVVSRDRIRSFGAIDVGFGATSDFCGSGPHCEASGHLVKQFRNDAPRVLACEGAVTCQASALLVAADLPFALSPQPRGVPPTGWGP